MDEIETRLSRIEADVQRCSQVLNELLLRTWGGGSGGGSGGGGLVGGVTQGLPLDVLEWVAVDHPELAADLEAADPVSAWRRFLRLLESEAILLPGSLAGSIIATLLLRH